MRWDIAACLTLNQGGRQRPQSQRAPGAGKRQMHLAVNRRGNAVQKPRQILESLHQMVQLLQGTADASATGTVLDPLSDAVLDVAAGNRQSVQLRRQVQNQTTQGDGCLMLDHVIDLKRPDHGLQAVTQLRGAERLGDVVVHSEGTAPVENVGVDLAADQNEADPRRRLELA